MSWRRGVILQVLNLTSLCDTEVTTPQVRRAFAENLCDVVERIQSFHGEFDDEQENEGEV